MSTLQEHKDVVGLINKKLDGKPPGYDDLLLYYSEANHILTECGNELAGRKFAFDVGAYVKNWSSNLYAETKDIRYWELYWSTMLVEAPHKLDSYCLYIERHRPEKERFYQPRRKTLIKVADMYQRLEDDELDECFIHLPPRIGKLLADDTDVLTRSGWKKHGDLIAGDEVIGSDGKWTKVIQVHPKHHTTHTVTFSDGTKVKCHFNHEWTLYDRFALKVKTMETSYMIGKCKNEEKNGKIRNRFFVDERPIVCGEEKELHVHPYVFGAWIGDGTTAKPCISDPESDHAIFDKIVECGYPIQNTTVHKQTGVLTVSFENLKDGLRKYGLCNRHDRNTKYIPDDYLTASVEQRLQLLAGLLDTDGTLCKKEHRYHYSTTNENIRNGVVALVNTFGWRVCVSIQEPKVSSFGIVGKQRVYIISFNPTMHIPCVLERKQLFEFSKPRRIAVDSVEESEPETGNCITVANSDGIYLVTRNMIPTHNSQMATMAMTWHVARNMELSNLYATYKESLGGAFLAGVTEIITDPTYTHSEVFPNCRIVATDAKAHKMDLGRRKKYTSLSGKGLESGLNGEYDANGWLLIDDILEGIQDVLSPDILRRKQIIFDNNLMSRKKEGAKVIYNGTIWSLHDIFSNRLDFLQNNPAARSTRVEVLKIPALNKKDQSNFDYDYGVGFSTKYFRLQRAKFEENEDMASWFAQYQQEPIERDGAVFNPEHMKFYNGVLPNEEPVRICAACDVALGGGDYLAMPVAYVYSDGSVYIHDVVFNNSEKNITQPRVMNTLVKNNVGSVFFESNAGGELYKDEVDDMIRTRGIKINMTSKYAPTNKRKEQRIWDKAPEIREFYFRDDTCRDPEYRRFMMNLYSFTINGKAKHDDAPDALATLAEFMGGTGVATATAVRNPFRSSVWR